MLLLLYFGLTFTYCYASTYDKELLFNDDVPEFETFLTPEDFELGDNIAETLNYESTQDIWDSDAMYNRDKFEGDIANDNFNLTTVDLFLNGNAATSEGGKWYNAIKNRLQLWPNGRIPYTISSKYSSYSRSLIASSMKEYATHTCIRWVPKETNDVNYIHIYPDRGCYSMVGKMGGKQSLSLGSGCIQKGIIIHELMHAVGFFHEQSRTDRDDHITIMWNNIQPGMQGQFEKYGHGTIQSLGTSYDYGSIMHYGTKAFSKNGQPTMIPKKPGAQIGQRNGFSSVDTFKINTLYGCTVDGGSSTTAPVTTTPAPVTTTRPPAPTIKPDQTTCKNLRGDCDDLAKNGWCIRNPGWMRAHCPISCGMCIPKTSPATSTPKATTTTAPRTAQPYKPSTMITPQPNSGTDCEDLRVDCLVLVSKRYCKISQGFMKSYCAKSCGFCFKPPPTEIPDESTNLVGKPVTTATAPTKIQSSTTPVIKRITVTTTNPPTTEKTKTCTDKKHFCKHWKSAGFCEGIFMNYMKKNCPLSCKQC